MNARPGSADQERADLFRYAAANVVTLTSDEVLGELREYGYKKDQVYRSIGELTCHMAMIGQEDTAQQIADTLLDTVDADEEGTLRTWSTVAEKGAAIADSRLRDTMGLQRDEDGNTIIPETVDIHDGLTFSAFLSLYNFGDKSLAPYLRQHVEGLQGEDTIYGARLAVRLFEAGDESAYDLVKSSAEKARGYVLAQQPAAEELSADDASDMAQILQGNTRALTPARSEMERKYAQTDIALKYFAVRLLEQGDVQRADEMQALMLSGFDNAWLCAKRFELGYDPDGTYAQAAKDYVAVFGEDSGDHLYEITDPLVIGGDPEVIAAYEFIYDTSVDPNDMDTRVAADMLVALHLSGDSRAHDRLIELIHDPDDVWLLISSLENMGLKDEALAAAKKAFHEDPNYNTGLQLLNLQYDAEAMKAVQTSISRFDRDLISVVYSRSRHLGKLAAHIVEIEQSDS